MRRATVLVDVGNTSTTVGFGRGARIWGVRHVPTRPPPRGAIRDVLSAARGLEIDGAILCSVVPGLTPTWMRRLAEVAARPPLVVSTRLRLGVRVRYPRPKSIGADRLVNACAAVERYGCPVIVADFGTALTFDVISGQGAYVGGVIAPGLPLMTDYLCERTALLPRVRLRGGYGIVGRSTAGAMRIGAGVGYRGMVREIVNHLRQDRQLRDAKLCATGGFAHWVLRGSTMPFFIDRHLTMHGLLKIYRLNNPRG